MQHTSLMSLDSRFAHDFHAMTFPFICQLSLAPLIAFWQQAISTQHPIKEAIASMVQDKLRQAPELLEPITDQASIAQHRELVDMLMSVRPWPMSKSCTPMRLSCKRSTGSTSTSSIPLSSPRPIRIRAWIAILSRTWTGVLSRSKRWERCHH